MKCESSCFIRCKYFKYTCVIVYTCYDVIWDNLHYTCTQGPQKKVSTYIPENVLMLVVINNSNILKIICARFIYWQTIKVLFS